MGLSGQFNWYESLQLGGRKAITFVLRCDNLFRYETFDCALMDSSGQTAPQIRRQLELKPRQEFRFDYDTCGWDWCVGDYFALLGKNNIIQKRWDCNPKMYERGGCPQCHGTHRCPQCGGNGFYTDRRSHAITSCTACHGTGRCQECYVPLRQGSPQWAAWGGNDPDPSISRQRQILSLQKQIDELQEKIKHEEFDLRMMQLKDIDATSHSVYLARLSLKSRYERQLIELSYKLQQLEQIR